MEALIKAIEIFATVTGVIYVLLEIWQKNLMWVVGIATGLACAFSFGVQHLYASMGLNIYYVGVSVWGLYQWKKDKDKLESESSIHLTRLTLKAALISLAVFVVGSLVLILILHAVGDPSSKLDATVTVMSAVGTWWLAKSYPQQWLVWIVADALSTTLCAMSGMPWMTVMYLCYFASAIYGYVHWKRNGQYV